MRTSSDRSHILLTGATGYVGGRLLKALEEAGHAVRCLARRPEFLQERVGPATEVVQGDCLQPESLSAALEGIDTAYYLVHSMGSGRNFESQDRQAAHNFGSAARQAGVRRIIYLGGLGLEGEGLSKHLRSRQETGESLRAGGVPVVELRASIILGSGSLSFEMIRCLVERLPVMICPRWVQVKAQPIHIQDVIAYLLGSLELACENRVYEIGGADQVSYRTIMQEYAHQRGLRRYMIAVPLLTPYLSSLWLGLTTPVYARVGRKLIESIKNPTVVRDPAALKAFAVRPVGLREALSRALRNEDRRFAATRWSDAISSGRSQKSSGSVTFGTRLLDARSAELDVPAEAAFTPIRRIGGDSGWYYANWLWRVRGFLDILVGGVGLRRGRRNQENLAVGDAVDFWRVEAFEPDRRLRLAAEMKVPGRAWLEFEVEDHGDGRSTVHQTAVFDPVGLFGLAYWYGIYPLHAKIFAGMLQAIAHRGKQAANRSAG